MYDLEDRTIRFSGDIINFCRKVERHSLLKPLANQLIRSGTSVGANYCEANGATSKKDFRNKIHICKKEAQETRYWLRVLEKEIPEERPQIKALFEETQQLVKIFAAIAEKSK
jgi:four helix bundle protein